MRTFFLAVLLLFAADLRAQSHHHDRAIEFPDVPGYMTLEVDLHMHTVFSDGSVWPNIRVEEAVRDGLDAIAVTEHIEYQPHKDDIPHPDRNRAHALAKESAGDAELLIIRGSEITRSMPPGHSNAIFLEDANALLTDDPIAAFRAARQQDAFIFWNHPMWESQAKDGMASLTDLHRQLIAEDLLHGIEVVNMDTYSEEALQIALDHGLTIIGTSDVHGLVDWRFEVAEGGHRPVTLVFAETRSEDAVKEALFAGRTVVWFDDLLVGKAEHMAPLLTASVQVVSAAYERDTSILSVVLENRSDAQLLLRNETDYTFHGHGDVVTLPANGMLTLRVKTRTRLDEAALAFEVLNAVTAPGEHAVLRLAARVE